MSDEKQIAHANEQEWERKLRANLEIIRAVQNPAVVFLPPISVIAWANLRNVISFCLAWLGAPPESCRTITAAELGIYPVSIAEISKPPELRKGK